MGFGKVGAKMLTERMGGVTFEDVAGVDEAKQDLQEIVEFLRDPENSSGSADGFRAACCWSSSRHRQTLIARAARAKPTCRSSPFPV